MHRGSAERRVEREWNDDHLVAICAFANSEGGKLTIGKDDNGTIYGVKDPKELMEMLPTKIKALFGFYPDIRPFTEDGKTYVEVNIEPQRKPVDLRGVYYERSGSSSVRVTGEDLVPFVLERSGLSWTDLISKKTRLSDISTEAVSAFVKRGQEMKRISSAADPNDTEGVLRRYGLMTDEGITNAGAVLFAECPTHITHSAVTKIGLFSKDGRLLMEDVIKMPVVSQPEETMRRLSDKYIQPRFELEGVVRKEKYQFPMLALRELIFNSIMHRQYMSSEHTTIRVYPDFVEIYNPGSLPEGWTAKELPMKHESKPANPRIAEIFHDMGIVEQWGRGMTLIREECKKAGIPQPIYETDRFGIKAVFKSIPDDGVSVIGIDDLAPLEFEVYKMIVEGRYTTADAASKALGSSERGIRRVTDKLRDMGMIQRAGSKKTGIWEPIAQSTNRRGI